MSELTSLEQGRSDYYKLTLTNFTSVLKNWNDMFQQESLGSDRELPTIEFRIDQLSKGFDSFFAVFEQIKQVNKFISVLSNEEQSELKSNIQYLLITIEKYPKFFSEIPVSSLYLKELDKLQNLL
jgi:hypothetical protein